MLPGPDGTRLAFIQATCFFNDNLHWSPLPAPGLSYHQSTYRILTWSEGRRGAFFLRTWRWLTASHRRNGPWPVRWTTRPSRPTSRATPQGHYDTYTVRAVGERGQTVLGRARGLGGRAAPAAPDHPLGGDGLFPDAARRGLLRGGDWRHRPAAGRTRRCAGPRETVAARLSLWTDLGLLTPEDLLRPVAVLIQPSPSSPRSPRACPAGPLSRGHKPRQGTVFRRRSRWSKVTAPMMSRPM